MTNAEAQNATGSLSGWTSEDDNVVNLFSRLREALKTTDDLRDFWNERASIEEQYATRLSVLGELPLGGKESGELQNVLASLRRETLKQADHHSQLADTIRSSLETPTFLFHAKQSNVEKTVQMGVEKKFKVKQAQEALLIKSKDNYDKDCAQSHIYKAQRAEAQAHGEDVSNIDNKLLEVRQGMLASRKSFNSASQALLDMDVPTWGEEWRLFCNTCQDDELSRLEFMKDMLWAYANSISTACVENDMSAERFRIVLEEMDPSQETGNFVTAYVTNSLGLWDHMVATLKDFELQRDPFELNGDAAAGSEPQCPSTGDLGTVSSEIQVPVVLSVDNLSGPSMLQPRRPLPNAPPASLEGRSKRILFHVKALYDYTATTDEELTFEAGDVIAVMAVPDDGWWSGQLVDEAKRQEGKHVFPSNFVHALSM